MRAWSSRTKAKRKKEGKKEGEKERKTKDTGTHAAFDIDSRAILLRGKRTQDTFLTFAIAFRTCQCVCNE
jgi:hypothetical protein